MDNAEARGLLEQHLQSWRNRSYAELLSLRDATQTTELLGASGTKYQAEVQVFWDGRPGGALRVLASIDDGGLRAFSPLSADFIKSQDGSFVGESQDPAA